ncbi:hypothetical protein JY719_18125 [Clostridioides difficile]|nr:hypothetical protein [Clostridioides difficile]
MNISKEDPEVGLFFYKDKKEIWIKKHKENCIENDKLIDKVTKTIFFGSILKLTIPINWVRELAIIEEEAHVTLELCKDKIILRKSE